MADPGVLAKFKDLDDGLDANAHLFCEDREKRKATIDCLQLFGFEGPDAQVWHEKLSTRLDQQLGKCDKCIISYYKAKKVMLEELRHEYDDEDVDTFAQMIDDRDVDRIQRGLSTAASTLQKLPPEKQRQSALDLTTLFAVFEALTCEKFFSDEELLRVHFNDTFRLLQTNKFLRVIHYLPTMTRFLFDTDKLRSNWAKESMRRMKQDVDKEDFDFAVRDQLSQQLIKILSVMPSPEIVQNLWTGLRLIVSRLPSNLITHSLRALDQDIYRIALDHLQVDGPGLRDLLQTINVLLIKGPKDFWDAMGAIAPTTVIEQIFNSPHYDHFMEKVHKEASIEDTPLNDMLSWVTPFVASLQTSHKPPACRSLTFQLLSRLQADRFPTFAQVECYRVGLEVLSRTMMGCNDPSFSFDSVGRVVAADTLNVVKGYMKAIIPILTLPSSDSKRVRLLGNASLTIKHALRLECNSLWADRLRIQRTEGLSPGFSVYMPTVWQPVVESLCPGNFDLAKIVLGGVVDLTGIERFESKKESSHPRMKERSAFNAVFGEITKLAVRVLEWLTDFGEVDLGVMASDAEIAPDLLKPLFSADQGIYEAGVNLIKTSSGESVRKDAISHLLRNCFAKILNGISWTIHRTAQRQGFACCYRMLKNCNDIVDILCDSQDGILRVQSLPDDSSSTIGLFWRSQWEALRVIYDLTMTWAEDNRNAVMTDFCRDVMQFSEHLVDQFTIFDSITSASQAQSTDIDEMNEGEHMFAKGLLVYPSRTLDAMVVYLKLRDEYLLSTSVKLTQKLLRQLSGKNMTLSTVTSDQIQTFSLPSAKKTTNMTAQQKAEILRALEENLGRPVSDVTRQHSGTSTPDSDSQSAAWLRGAPKQGRIDMGSWVAKAKASNEIDRDIAAASSSVERFKAQQSTKNFAPLGFRDKKPLPTPMTIQRPAKEKAAQQEAFLKSREQARREKKLRDAEAIARAKKNLLPNSVAGQTSGEGSALGNFGNTGREHAPKGSGIMVSSDSESEMEDELDQELFGSLAKKKTSNAVKDYNASRLKQAQSRGPIKKTRQIRSAKDMRARVAPDLSSLHRTILSWDLFHDGDFPPGSTRDNYALVSNSFRTAMDYRNTFEPLLLLEAWQGFRQAREEANSKPFSINIANRMTLDNLVEVSSTMEAVKRKELGIFEGDIMLISKSSTPSADAGQPHCLARVSKIKNKQNAIEITFSTAPGNPLLSSLNAKATVHCEKVTSIVPLEREYGALLGLIYYDLCDEIIKAYPSPLLPYSDSTIGKLESIYALNKAQAKAVQSAIDNDAFTLIQGPPGSGKTKTIVAIVGALLTDVLRDSNAVTIARPQISNGATQSQPDLIPKKLLVCAPSNAAVDELVMRFMQGVKTRTSEFHQPSILRLGKSESINPKVKEVTLEELVNKRVNTVTEKPIEGDDIHKVMMEHKATCDQLVTLRAELDDARSKGHSISAEQNHSFDVLKQRKGQLGNRIDRIKDNGNTFARDAEIRKNHIRQEIIDGAHILCATLSGSGHDMFRSLKIDFETVIIDEAAQSIELSALIPLKYGCSKCIMVGDPKQLPPTVLSREAARFQYEQSIFVRMQLNSPENVHLLDTQYRMHPEISAFPSQAFYDGLLLDGPGMAKLRTKPWHMDDLMSPYRFFDVQGMHQSAPKGHSLINLAEVDVAMHLFRRLTAGSKGYDFTGKVGIITPYKSQLATLKERFQREFGNTISDTVEFNTTDAFQGRESEVIIFSCVRASNKGIGFLSDIRRMNVGITRAKSSLWVLGNSMSLMQGEYWSKLIQDARHRSLYTEDVLDAVKRLPRTSGAHTNGITKPERPCELSTDIEMPDAPPLKTEAESKQIERPKPVIPSDSQRVKKEKTNLDKKRPLPSPTDPPKGSKVLKMGAHASRGPIVPLTMSPDAFKYEDDPGLVPIDAHSAASSIKLEDQPSPSTPQLSKAEGKVQDTPNGTLVPKGVIKPVVSRKKKADDAAFIKPKNRRK